MEGKFKHLDFIQQTLSRMSSNSFFLRGWSVTLLVGLFAFANVKQLDSNYALIAFIPTVFFWLLDGYYLHQERLFRKLYDDVRQKESSEIDYSMSTSPYNKDGHSWFRTCFSIILLLFYAPLIIVTIFIAWVLPLI